MHLLSGIRSRTKRAEATTDESQLSASTWRNSLKWLHRSRSAAATPAKQFRHRELNIQEVNTTDDLSTDSGVDLFQTLMSNSQPRRTGDTGNNKSKNDGDKESYWHTHDPNFLPTAYPLSRNNPKVVPKAKWGSLNLAAAAALLEAPLKRFDTFANKQPRFRFGPRVPKSDEDANHPQDYSSMSEKSLSQIETQPEKYAFIFQDGKLVEREVTRWPRRKEMALEMRYKHSEPYSYNYGKMKAKRINATGPKYTQPRTRWIYDRPIFLLPRKVIAENKRRLMARHSLKDMNNTADGFRLPASHTMGETEQCKRYLFYQKLSYIKQTEERIAHEEKMKAKANTPTGRR